MVGDAATLDLTGAALQVNALHTGFGDVFTIVSSAAGGISGVFTGRSEGSKLTVGGRLLQIHYTPNAVTLADLQASHSTREPQPCRQARPESGTASRSQRPAGRGR